VCKVDTFKRQVDFEPAPKAQGVNRTGQGREARRDRAIQRRRNDGNQARFPGRDRSNRGR
jgi:hypothetical protein